MEFGFKCFIAFTKFQVHLCFGEVELRCKLNTFWSRQVFLRSEALFEPVQLLVTEHGPCFAASTCGGRIARAVQFERRRRGTQTGRR